ncbi:MAG: hypothetical protein U1E47_05835 [Rivihabitans pingtungensis]
MNLFADLLAVAPCLPLAGAGTRFQPVWVEDVAHVLADCLDRADTHGQRYELAGPETFTLAELVRYVGQLTGHPRPVFGLPEGLAMAQAALMERLPKPPMSRDNVRSLRHDNVSAGLSSATLALPRRADQHCAGLAGRQHPARALRQLPPSGAALKRQA